MRNRAYGLWDRRDRLLGDYPPPPLESSDAQLKDALRSYVERAVALLQESGHALPPLDRRVWGWHAIGDGHFVYRGPESERPMLPWEREPLHSLPEFGSCLDVLRAHPVIAPRLDTLVGSALSASRLEAENIPDLALSSMLSDAEELGFDEARFDEAATGLIAWLTRSEEVHRAVAPLSGVVADATPIVLEAGVEIDEMTDEEVINCLTVGLLSGLGSMGHAMTGPRVALRIRDSFELALGDDHDGTDTSTAQGAFERWRDIAEAVVFTLRLLKPGTVSSPGFVSNAESYLGTRGGQFTPSATPRHTMFERYRLDAADAVRLPELWAQLRSPNVGCCKPLTTAIRRFGFTGERSRAEDQIIDLMIAAEAVFLPGEDSESAHKLSLRAALLLEGAVRPARDIATVMKRAYDARSNVAHGGNLKPLKLPDGTAATLEEYVAIVSGYVRDALSRFIADVAAGNPSPFQDWDRFTYDRFASRR